MAKLPSKSTKKGEPKKYSTLSREELRDAYSAEQSRIENARNNFMPAAMHHDVQWDNAPFNVKLPASYGDAYCTTRACEMQREAGFPVNQVESGYKLMQEMTPENGWYPTTYDTLAPGDFAQVVRNAGHGHTMVSTGNKANNADMSTLSNNRKGFYWDSGSGHNFEYAAPDSEQELKDWMGNVKDMKYFTYKGDLPVIDQAFANAPQEQMIPMQGKDMTKVRISQMSDPNIALKRTGGDITMRKVRITNLPIAAMGGAPYKQTPPNYRKDDLGEKQMRMRKLLEGVPRDQANVEAERGESVVVPDQGGLPAHYKIGGQRHHSGGTPLNIPEDSFIYSDTKAMIIKDPDLIKEFGMAERKKGYTPAEIAKKYDINKYREILQDPHQDDLAKDTAEKMVKNYNMKLGKLALLQEAMKGFPTGIPLVAVPYMEANSIEPEDVLPDHTKEQDMQAESSENEMVDQDFSNEEQENPDLQRYGGIPKRGNLDVMSRLRKVRIHMNAPTDPNNGLYIMEGGGAPPSSATTKKAKIPSDAVIIKRSDYATDAEYTAARDKAFKEAKDKNKVYVDAGNGTYKKIQGKAFQYPEYKGQDLDKAFKGNKERANRYQYIENQVANNPELKQKLYDETIKMLEDTKKKNPKSLKSRGVDIDKMIAELTPDKVTENFLQMQKRNIALGTHLGEDKVKGSSNAPTAGGISNKELTDAAATAGIPMPDAVGAALQQAAYVAFDNLADRKEAPGFTPGQFGAADEKTGKKATISPVDAIYTNTTSGQITGIAGEDGVEEVDPEMEDVTNPQEVTQETPEKAPDTKFGYYTQDNANLALAAKNAMGVKKYMPWARPVNLQTPEIMYHSPEAAEQQALGAFNTAARAANVYGTGQTSNRLADMFGKTLENANMIEAQTQQADVAVTNQFNAQKADTANKNEFANADQAMNIYDRTIMANQNYDNTRRAMNEVLTNVANTRETNAANTYNINTTNQNFQIDPTRSGKIYFHRGTQLQPGESPDFATTFANLRSNANLSMLDSQTLANIAGQQMGYGNVGGKKASAPTQNDTNKQYLDMYGQIYPGQVGPPTQ